MRGIKFEHRGQTWRAVDGTLYRFDTDRQCFERWGRYVMAPKAQNDMPNAKAAIDQRLG